MSLFLKHAIEIVNCLIYKKTVNAQIITVFTIYMKTIFIFNHISPQNAFVNILTKITKPHFRKDSNESANNQTNKANIIISTHVNAVNISCNSSLVFQAIAVTCLGLHYKSITGDTDTDVVSAGTFAGFIVILIGSFAGKVTNKNYFFVNDENSNYCTFFKVK